MGFQKDRKLLAGKLIEQEQILKGMKDCFKFFLDLKDEKITENFLICFINTEAVIKSLEFELTGL